MLLKINDIQREGVIKLFCLQPQITKGEVVEYTVDDYTFPSTVELIRVANVPAIMDDKVHVVEDSRLKDKLVISADKRLKRHGMFFTFKIIGKTLYVYWGRRDEEDLFTLAEEGFTVRVPAGRLTDVEVV